MIHWLQHASHLTVCLLGVAGAVLFELGTVILRFGCRLRSAESTSFLSRFTFGLRIHHGFVGLACLLVAAFPVPAVCRRLLVVLGISLALSDVIHHFVVLPLTVGATEFDLVYPRSEP